MRTINQLAKTYAIFLTSLMGGLGGCAKTLPKAMFLVIIHNQEFWMKSITEKQIRYVKSLCKSKNKSIPKNIEKYSSAEASVLINSILNNEKVLKIKKPKAIRDEISKLDFNIRSFSRAGLILRTLNEDKITKVQLKTLHSNLSLIFDFVIPMLKGEVRELIEERRLDIDQLEKDFIDSRITRLENRISFMTSVNNRSLKRISIAGFHKKIAGYIIQLFNKRVDLIEDNVEEMLKAGEFTRPYL